jgi:hypothetical protein
VTGATEYRIYWSLDPSVGPSNGTRIAGITGTGFNHQGLAAGTDYHYVVTAVSSLSVESVPSPEVGGRPGGSGLVTLTAGDQRVTLDWIDVVTSISYVSSRSSGIGPPFAFPYPVTGLENGVRYTFEVFPSFSRGEGRPSAPVYATLAATTTVSPQGVTLTTGRGKNTLTWSPVGGALGYNVQWNEVGGSAPPNQPVDVDDTVFHHNGLQMCTTRDASCPTYSYTVTAVGQTIASATVEAVSIDLHPFPPLITNATPLILTGLKPADSSVRLNGIEIVPLNRNVSWEYSAALVGGANTLNLVAIDADGQTSAVTTYQVTLDAIPPSQPQATTTSCVAAPPGPPRATIAGTKESNTAIFRREADGNEVLVVGSDGQVPWTTTLDASPGPVTFTFFAQDTAGNTSPIDVTDSFVCPS